MQHHEVQPPPKPPEYNDRADHLAALAGSLASGEAIALVPTLLVTLASHADVWPSIGIGSVAGLFVGLAIFGFAESESH